MLVEDGHGYIEDSKKPSGVLVRTKENWTKGISVTNNTNDSRFLFFELDRPYSIEDHDRITSVYNDFSLDYLNHRSGNGKHWFSPTLLSKKVWKEISSHLKDINPKWPRWTLRAKCNKYVNENEIWFNHNCRASHDNIFRNSIQLSNLLNVYFHPYDTLFIGKIHTNLKIVNYKFEK